MTNEQLEEYVRFRSDPRNDELTDGMWAARNGVQLLLEGDRLYAKEVQERVLDGRRKRYAKELAEVDAAIIKKAKTGDSKAAALLYARFEGWTPRTAERERPSTAQSFAELLAEEEGAP
jgi:hypothetical protein